MYPSPPVSPSAQTVGLPKRTPSPTDRLSCKDHSHRGYNRRTRTKTAELGPSKDQRVNHSEGDLKQVSPSYLPRRVPPNRMASRSSSFIGCTTKTTVPTQKTSRQQYPAGLSIVYPTPHRWTADMPASPHLYRASSTPRQPSRAVEEPTSNGPRHIAVTGRRRTTDVPMSSSSLSSSPLSSSPSSTELTTSSGSPKRPYRNAPRIISYTLPPEVEMSWSSPLVSPSLNAGPVFFSAPCKSIPVSTPSSSHPFIRQESEAEFHLRGVLGKSDKRAIGVRPSDRRSISFRSSSSSAILSDREAEAKRKQAEREFAEDIARWVDGAPEIPRALLSTDKTKKDQAAHTVVGNVAGFENRGRMTRPSIQDRRVTAPVSSFSMLRTASPAGLSTPSSSSRHSSPARQSPDRTLSSTKLINDNNSNNITGLNKKRTHSTSSAHSMPYVQTPLGRSFLGSFHATPPTPTTGLLSPPSPHSARISLSSSVVSPSSTRFPLVESRSTASIGSAVPPVRGDFSEDTFDSESFPSSSSINSGLVLPRSQARAESGFDLDQTMERCSRIEGYISFQEVGIGNIFDGDEEEDEPAEQDAGGTKV
ncbi:hypothetical protein [Phaffia rhodozyma]|uniref:Uncharacterized protein n=1 Tax=Phaffia rhodozyma TaxID=264483 RepID=A0A0F7SN17_PHARH|nr:hypothetical protein [Phaffia rhodozyma]